MASFLTTSPNALQQGLLIPIDIGPSSQVRTFLKQKGQPIIGPFEFSALIDTGASISCISPRVAQKLHLTPRGVVPMASANLNSLTNLYEVYLDLSKVFKQPIGFDPIPVMEAPLPGQGNVDCLIGRDVLNRGVLIYVGYTGSFSFSV